ncbi:uncharacterized protein B0H18DRAFT_333437 [Fomitopsis serialis]|uniref:uncharacterized protein n=1 Tax=Fomitopsis serialis TaxID=139415 RepID=UPI00200888F1|nr:uncharacterized protein B0H18DRAFT_333437 [Neoantrodia serialis]KAH9926804.1 hypothetical protein B0H18DRAFT_333437 [Neoantrodia serialis]
MSRTAAQTFRRRSALSQHAKHPSVTNTTSGPRRLSEGTLAFDTNIRVRLHSGLLRFEHPLAYEKLRSVTASCSRTIYVVCSFQATVTQNADDATLVRFRR